MISELAERDGSASSSKRELAPEPFLGTPIVSNCDRRSVIWHEQQGFAAIRHKTRQRLAIAVPPRAQIVLPMRSFISSFAPP